ncbi:hypothetical protein Fcan01_17384 [Folsomia candida]|uniref:Uncharacterized protein n=1 Tax=Folsomia candida TaxID=158441 RepID=A0A226DT54_FOLCA|nr:hypothetical protein Fcan01_17384 [Folsomia candida]
MLSPGLAGGGAGGGDQGTHLTIYFHTKIGRGLKMRKLPAAPETNTLPNILPTDNNPSFFHPGSEIISTILYPTGLIRTGYKCGECFTSKIGKYRSLPKFGDYAKFWESSKRKISDAAKNTNRTSKQLPLHDLWRMTTSIAFSTYHIGMFGELEPSPPTLACHKAQIFIGRVDIGGSRKQCRKR